MAGSAFFILEGLGTSGLGRSIAAAGNATSVTNEGFVVLSREDTVGAVIYTGVASSAEGFPVDASTLAQTEILLPPGVAETAIVLGGYDFNEDGRTDIVIGVPTANDGAGAVYVVFGGMESGEINLASGTPDGASAIMITGIAGSAGFGSSLAAVQGDAGATLYIGHPNYENAGVIDAGGIAVVTLTESSGNIAVGEYDFKGGIENSQIGTSITTGFDLDGNGDADVAFTSPGTGSVIVRMNYGLATERQILTLSGTGEGATVSAGNLNGDMFDDLIVTSPTSGTVYVLFGRQVTIDTPFAPEIDITTIESVGGVVLTGSIGSNPGAFFATFVGDVTGDGIGDLLIGGVTSEGLGRAYLVFGSDTLMSVNLDTLDGTNGFIFSNIDLGGVDFGGFTDAFTGAGIGDVNNDGIGDIAFGMPDAADAAGKVFGVLGGLQNLIALDGLDGAQDGVIEADFFLGGEPPAAAFIETDDSVTFGGDTVGRIDLGEDQLEVTGRISIEDEDTPDPDSFIGSEVTSLYGTIIVEDDGDDENGFDRWRYVVNPSAVAFLPEGQEFTDQLVLVADNGSQRAINITIIGKDDPIEYTLTPNPTVAGLPTDVLLTEDFASITGSFAANDPDEGQDPDFAGQTIEGLYGTFIISPGGTDGTTFTYILNPDLVIGDDVVETITPTGASNGFQFTIEARGTGAEATYQLIDAAPDQGAIAFFGRGDEIINGTNNGDRIDTGAGNDRVNGGTGNDIVTDPFGNDTLIGGGGNDDITALSGDNTIDGSDSTATEGSYLKGGVGRDTIIGGDGDDFLDGDYASSLIGAGDRLDGGAGDDHLRGGLGADVFVFGPGYGNDVIADFDVDVVNGMFQLVQSSLRRDFTVGLDKVELRGFGVNDLNGFELTTSDGNAVLRQIGDTDNSLTFVGLTADQITADSFIFV